jgi:hypothetical protein
VRKIAFILGLVLFLLLAACNQTPKADLATQGRDYGQVRFNIVSDYMDGTKETNFNGKFDKGEFLVPDIQVRLTPINEKGDVIGEAFSFITNHAKDPLEGAILKVPVGIYQPELVLPTDLLGGKEYTWKPFGPDPKLPPIIVKYKDLFDGIYSIGCEFGGKQFIQINGFDEYPLSPCFSQTPEVQDGISVSPSSVEFPCNGQQIQTAVKVFSANGLLLNPVALSVDPNSLPAGMTASFNPNSTTSQSTLTLPRNGVAPGSYQIIVRDSRGLGTTLTVTVPSIVAIPDTNLKSALRTALSIPQSNEICKKEALLLTRLDANSRGISNLEGLQYATNLTVLTLFGNSITDLTPLSGLTNLRILALSFNHISDITALINNTGLGSGDEIDLRSNLLDLRGLPDLDSQNIATLRYRGVTVNY